MTASLQSRDTGPAVPFAGPAAVLLVLAGWAGVVVSQAQLGFDLENDSLAVTLVFLLSAALLGCGVMAALVGLVAWLRRAALGLATPRLEWLALCGAAALVGVLAVHPILLTGSFG